MTKTPIQINSTKLRPKARLIKLIGEELISDENVAILEIVKNSYDADATKVTVSFKGSLTKTKISKKNTQKEKLEYVFNKENTKIIISDNGIGMDLETLLTKWMEPATNSKKKSKYSKIYNRRYTGEKGIGRFATSKLSKKLTIISRMLNNNEIKVVFNWNEFDNEESYLDEINCDWEVREPIYFSGNTHGTCLFLEHLNSEWDKDKILKLKIILQRLINPITPIENFNIYIELPYELKDYAGLVCPSGVLTKSNYSIKGYVDSLGNLTYYYESAIKSYSEKKLNSLLSLNEDFLIGEFEFDFKVWDLDSDSLNNFSKLNNITKKNVREQLKENAGISIYRDGFRVLPYGDPKYDWVNLDLRRVNNPTMNISNNQIIGFIKFEIEKNPEFKDQTNREGLIESDAFEQLKNYIIAILKILETHRYNERPRVSLKVQNEDNLSKYFELSDITKYITEKLPLDIELRKIIENTQKTISLGLIQFQETITRYQRLTTLGSLFDMVLHDANNIIAKIDVKLYKILKLIENFEINYKVIIDELNRIQEQKLLLSKLFKKLEPFGGYQKRQFKEIIIEDNIRSVFDIYKNEIENQKIQINLPETQTIINIDENDLQLIIINLLQNSLYWLSKVNYQKQISLQIIKDTNIIIFFKDNGPGINEENINSIFLPYFSTKPNGIGLGLTIVGELISSYNGELVYIDDNIKNGATFQITLKKDL